MRRSVSVLAPGRSSTLADASTGMAPAAMDPNAAMSRPLPHNLAGGIAPVEGAELVVGHTPESLEALLDADADTVGL